MFAKQRHSTQGGGKPINTFLRTVPSSISMGGGLYQQNVPMKSGFGGGFTHTWLMRRSMSLPRLSVIGETGRSTSIRSFLKSDNKNVWQVLLGAPLGARSRTPMHGSSVQISERRRRESGYPGMNKMMKMDYQQKLPDAICVRKGEEKHAFSCTLCFGQNFFGPKQWKPRKNLKIVVSAETARNLNDTFFGKKGVFGTGGKVVFTNNVFEKLCFLKTLFLECWAKCSSCNKTYVFWIKQKMYETLWIVFGTWQKGVFGLFVFRFLMFLWLLCVW